MSRPASIALAVVVTTLTMLVLDLTWLGVIARGFYDASLGGLKRPDAYLPAAGLFYVFYVAAIVVYAVLGAKTVGEAAKRGAAMGLLAYGTYELTNWAVIKDWPPMLVPVDLAWGVIVTAVSAAAGKKVLPA